MSDIVSAPPVQPQPELSLPQPGLRTSLAEGAEPRLARVRRYLLDVPLLYKILLADAGIIFLIGILCVALVAEAMNVLPTQPLLLFWTVALGGVMLTIPVRLYILRRTLAPIEILQDTAERVEGGDMRVRAEQLPLSDPRLARLTDVFNRVLDTVLADRGRLQEIAAKAFRAQEAERVRIARELHEEVAQTMTSLLLRLRFIRDAADADARSSALDELRHDLVQTMDSIREFARGLHPPALHDLGLAAAIEGYARTLSGTSGLRITTEAAETHDLLTPEQELALYRIVQEALSNVVRHANAEEASVRVLIEPSEIVVEVRDGGRGFTVGEREDGNPCLGLFGMRERALYVGGSVTVESEPLRGTTVSARMPRVA